MRRITRRETLAGVGLVLLAGCGGGGTQNPPTGSGQAPTPSPTPTPTPSPTPSPTPLPNVGSFGTLGATASQVFATLGHSQLGKGSGWDFVADSSTFNVQPGHAIRLAAPSSLLLMVPGLGEGALVTRNNSGSFFNGERIEAYFDVLGGFLFLSKPIVEGRLQQYVMQAYFVSSPEAYPNASNLILQFGYGIAAPPNALPSSGQAEYQSTFSETEFAFRADFGAKVISGTMPFFVNGPTQSSELRDVTISADGTGFSGRLIPPDGSAEGTIQGLFMGPNGEEFLAQTILKSGQSVTLFSGIRAT